jgi:hypothetical protein
MSCAGGSSGAESVLIMQVAKRSGRKLVLARPHFIIGAPRLLSLRARSAPLSLLQLYVLSLLERRGTARRSVARLFFFLVLGFFQSGRGVMRDRLFGALPA